MASDETWFWDLRRKQAVPASERGAADDVLGPYATKGEAQNWRSTVESRNDAWDDDDDAWNDDDTER